MTVEDTLKVRKNQHGDFTDVARCSQLTMNIWRSSKNWDKLSDVQKEALTLIAHKASRILVGDPDWPDHWHDIGGYAKLAEDRLPAEPQIQVLEPGQELIRKVGPERKG